MTTIQDTVIPALNEFDSLSKKFESLISNADQNLDSLNSLRVIESSKDTLMIEVMGKVIQVQFSMVFQKKDMPLGQISATLIEKKKSISQMANGDIKTMLIWPFHRHDHMSLIYWVERKDGYVRGKAMSACKK